ncbi:MAG: hypothetical protein AAFU57_08160 [Bacteroidota bacterium]
MKKKSKTQPRLTLSKIRVARIDNPESILGGRFCCNGGGKTGEVSIGQP